MTGVALFEGLLASASSLQREGRVKCVLQREECKELNVCLKERDERG